jgi:hypothetical protein
MDGGTGKGDGQGASKRVVGRDGEHDEEEGTAMTQTAVAALLRDVAARGSGESRRVAGNGQRLLPVVPGLAALLPEPGLRRGTTATVAGSTSLLLSLLAAPSRDGGWCAVVGFGALGVLAAAEAGVVLERTVLVPDPGPRWPTVVAALVDAMDVVAVRPPRPAGADGRRLVARARERGSVLLGTGAWDGADLRLSVEQMRWEGLGRGHGRLRRYRALVRVEGRGAASRPRHAWLTGASGLDGGGSGDVLDIPDIPGVTGVLDVVEAGGSRVVGGSRGVGDRLVRGVEDVA